MEDELQVPRLGFESSYQEIALWFGIWLNYYFYPWNPDDSTWIDLENRAFSTEELFKQFSEKYIK